MAKDMTKDMTKGSPMRLILGFALPLLFGFLFQQFYNVVDTIIVGRFNGDDALAAVGASFAVTKVMIAFATGTGTGCSVLVSKLYGETTILRLRRRFPPF